MDDGGIGTRSAEKVGGGVMEIFIGLILFWIGWDLMALRGEMKDAMKEISDHLSTIARNTQKLN